MDSEGFTRRSFVAGSGAVAGSALARSSVAGLLAVGQTACTARDEGAPFTLLSGAEARELEAIAARILPTTDTPGAREAGVVYFMDRAFASFMEPTLPMVREGLASFARQVPIDYPGARAFSDLDAADQDAFLATQEGGQFFEFVRFLTLAGFFAMSSYGGNRDHVGWKLLGMDPAQHAHQYPFGWYDAEAAARVTDETDDA